MSVFPSTDSCSFHRRITEDEFKYWFTVYVDQVNENEQEIRKLTDKILLGNRKLKLLNDQRTRLEKRGSPRNSLALQTVNDEIYSRIAKVQRLQEERKPLQKKVSEVKDCKRMLVKRVPLDSKT